MSQSPSEFQELAEEDAYIQGWQALGSMISRGASFSGRERNCAFLNTGGPRFANVSGALGLDAIDDARAVVPVDWDQDGDLDLWYANRTAPRVRFLRNDLDGVGEFVAFRLTGRQCNRDAIGTRIEVHLGGESPVTLIDTLRAGDGFVSQTGKWMHFGLGDEATIEKVVVRWPGQKDPQVLTSIEPGQRYRITQGREPEIAKPRTDVAWKEDSELSLPKPSDVARIVLTSRPGVPDLPYNDFEGRSRPLRPQPGRALLINFWASWCPNCKRELKELADASDSLLSRGLEMIALSTDGLSAEDEGDREKAQQWLDRIGWKSPSGVATEQLIQQLTTLMNEVVYKEVPLPLPTSFLVDPRGGVIAIYKGPVSVEQLTADLALADAPFPKLQEEAFPFAGRSTMPLFKLSPVGVAQAFSESGYHDDARRILKSHISDQLTAGTTSQDPAWPARLAESYLTLSVVEDASDNPSASLNALRNALQWAPNNSALHVAIGVQLWSNNQKPLGEQHLSQARAMTNDNPQTLGQIGIGFLAEDQLGQAADYLEQATTRGPRNPMFRFSYANVLERQGRLSAAVEQYRLLLKGQPDHPEGNQRLSWLLSTSQSESLRDADEALRLAKRLRQKVGNGPEALDTLAAAYAASGDFDEAVRIGQQARKRASAGGRPELTEQIDERLKLYRDGQPYRAE